jgi:putative Ca2+/H+ antiporter (TMEM165/GDT1 family)
MEYIYSFIIAFSLIFFSELGDKTQLLVLSFSTKSKTSNILFGIALGTFFSHGIAILFGSKIGSLENESLHFILKIITYITFLIFGIIGFLPKKEKTSNEVSTKSKFFNKINLFSFNYIFIVALSIIVGELGDKTFLASLGLGLQYPNYKLSLILGAITGMVASDALAIFFGKLLGNKLPNGLIEFISNCIFLVFGIIGLIILFLST